MNSIELAKSIYEKASQAGKQAWLSDKQNRFIFSLLEREGRLNHAAKKHFVAYILPNGEWIQKLTIGEAIKIGEENIKHVYIVSPPFYIRREGFKTQKIIVL